MKFEEWVTDYAPDLPSDCGRYADMKAAHAGGRLAGQEEMREEAVSFVDNALKSGKSHRSVLIGLTKLLLEGDDE